MYVYSIERFIRVFLRIFESTIKFVGKRVFNSNAFCVRLRRLRCRRARKIIAVYVFFEGKAKNRIPSQVDKMNNLTSCDDDEVM